MPTTTEHTDGADLIGLLAGSLPNGLDPFPDESLAGFVMRMAENHGYAAPMQLLKPLVAGSSTLRQAVLRWAEHPGMAEYLALRPDEIERLGSGRGSGTRVLGHALHEDLVILAGRKVCPLCIAEQAYHRAHWDLTLMTVCPVHAVVMLTHCPECTRALNWRAGPLTCCPSQKCGADLRWTETASVPQAEMGGIRGLHRLVTTGRCEEFPAPIAALSVSDQMQLAFHMGCLATGRHRMIRPQGLAKLHPDQVHLVLDAGWRMCAGWPSAFHAHLDRRRANASGSGGRYGIRKHFGTLRAWIEENGEPYAKLIGAELTNYIVSRPELATRAPAIRRARKTAPVKQRTLTMAETRDVLGVSFNTIHALAAEHDLYLVPPTGSGAPALFRADLVEALRQERSRLLTKEDVRALLGTGKATVDKLRLAGLLPTVADAADPDGVLYPVAGVEDLLADLAGRLPPGSGKPRKTAAVTMATIARQVPRPGFDVSDVIEAVRAGKLVPCALARGARGLHRILFRQADVDRFVAEFVAVPGRTMSVVEAARELGVKQEVAYHWVRTNLLETVTGGAPGESGCRVTQAALEAFRREYVTGTEFARVHRLSPKWAAHHLIEAGVEPVSGPMLDGARQILFRRGDLEGIDPERLVSGRSKLRPETTAHSEELKARYACDAALEQALQREFGGGLVRRYNVYRADAAGVVIQAMTARNSGTVGTYEFLLSAKQRDDLVGAAQGFLALGFYGRPDFLLVPWAEVEAMLNSLQSHETPRRRVWRLWIRADAQELLEPLGQYALPLARSAEG